MFLGNYHKQRNSQAVAVIRVSIFGMMALVVTPPSGGVVENDPSRVVGRLA